MPDENIPQPVEVKEEGKQSLKDVIKDAFEDRKEEVVENVKEKIDERKEKRKEEKDNKEEKVDPATPQEAKVVEDLPFGLSEEEQLQALQLFRGLKDPVAGRAIVRGLAEMAQLNISEKDGTLTKKDIKEDKDELLGALSEQFGEDFAAKLAPALKATVDKLVEERTKDVRESIRNSDLEKIEDATTKAYSELSQEFHKAAEFPQAIQQEMSKVMDTVKPAKGQSPKDYLRDVYFIAAGRTGTTISKESSKETTKVENREKKIEQNRKNIGEKLSSERGPSTPTMNKNSFKDPSRVAQYGSLSEAIKSAMESVSEQMGMDR